MSAVRERASSTMQNALPGTTLQIRSAAALFILQKTCSGRLIQALMELGKLNITVAKDSLLLCISLSFSSQTTQSYDVLVLPNYRKLLMPFSW
jgi:hypothetical protein